MKPGTSADSQSGCLEFDNQPDSTKSIELPDIKPGETPAPRKKRKYRSRTRARSPATVTRMKRIRRSKANDRERHRMHNLNDGLEMLREVLPIMPDDNKMTKIETLRMALNYIVSLEQLLKLPEPEMLKLRQANILSTPAPDSYQIVPCTPEHTVMGHGPVKTVCGLESESLRPSLTKSHIRHDCSVPDIGMHFKPQYSGPSCPLPHPATELLATTNSSTELVSHYNLNNENCDYKFAPSCLSSYY